MPLCPSILDAIFSVGVRINLMDVVGRKENTLLATTMNSTKLEQTISSVLGSKFLASVAPVSIDLTQAVDAASPKGDWKIEGYISRASDDNNEKGGASAKAGQVFFSINGRPVELPKLARTMGDVWRILGGKKKPSCVLTLTLPNQEYDVNLSPEKRQVLLTNEAAICEAFRIGIEELWASQTVGQFTHSASQPVKEAAAAKSKSAVTSTGKPAPPKVDNMESLLNLQASNRKRALEKHAQIPTAPTRRRNDIDEMDVDSQDEDEDDDDDDESVSDDAETAAKRAYMRKFREEQSEQRKLNSKPGDIDCQYGEEAAAAAAAQEQQPQPHDEEDPSPRRIRRRGAFVHDISKAKQFDRSAAIGINFEIPEGIEDPDDSENDETEEARPEAPTKKQRMDASQGASETSPVPTGGTLQEKDVMADVDTTKETASSRRVTLTMNNEASAVNPSSSPAAAAVSDGDKLLWTKAQASFNNREDASPQKEIEALVKTSVSPEKAFRTPHVTHHKPAAKATHSSQVLNLEQFAFRQGNNTAIQPPASPEVATKTQQHAMQSRAREKASASKRKSERGQEHSANDSLSTTDDVDADSFEATPCSVVWDSFQGTESVVAMTKQERKRMQERKRKLRGARARNGFDEEDDGTNDITDKMGKTKVTLAKGNFGEMTILGQFNLGFILAKDPKNQLWILDQHACDERFNFERLMTETVMHNQTLIAPMPLELDPSEESCVLDNMQIFEKNGFKFKYDETKPPRHRLALTALPHSGARDGRKAVNFGKEDVSALCAILGASSSSAFDNDPIDYASGAGGGTGSDGSGLYGNNAVRRYAGSQVLAQGDEADKVITRLPKAIAMFASRACRGSVMIGTALSKKEMEKVVKRIDDLNDPWKCAHGRPTMTHVTDLQFELLNDERRAAEHISGPTVSMSLTQPGDMEL